MTCFVRIGEDAEWDEANSDQRTARRTKPFVSFRPEIRR